MSNGEQPKVENCQRRKQWIRGILALGTTAGFLFVVIWTVITGLPKPSIERDLLLLLLGSLVTLTTTINAFYFGSSLGSQDKTELLAGE